MGEAAGNGTKAAQLAGYKGSNGTLRAQASENMRLPAIRAALAERAANDPLVATRQDRQQMLTRIMNDEEEETRDRLKAIDLLSKTQGDYIERVEHTGKDGGPIETKAGLSAETIEALKQKVLGISK